MGESPPGRSCVWLLLKPSLVTQPPGFSLPSRLHLTFAERAVTLFLSAVSYGVLLVATGFECLARASSLAISIAPRLQNSPLLRHLRELHRTAPSQPDHTYIGRYFTTFFCVLGLGFFNWEKWPSEIVSHSSS